MSLDFQSVVVFIVIAAACAYAGSWLRKKAGSFSKKKDCGSDCGCGDDSKNLPS